CSCPHPTNFLPLRHATLFGASRRRARSCGRADRRLRCGLSFLRRCVLFPFKMMTIEGSYVGTIEDLRDLLALVRARKVPPIPIETRPADQASAALSDLKSGGKVRGRVVLRHQ